MKQSLTEELRGTLVAHSLEAPEPAASIAAVLARTSGDGAVGDGGAGDGAGDGGGGGAGGGAGRPKRQWASPARIAAALAAAAAVLVGVAVVNTARTSGTHQSATSSAGSAKESNGQSAGSAEARAPGAPADGSGFGGVRAAAAGCPAGDTSAVLDPVALTPTVAGHQLFVLSSRCWRADGDQDPSSVVVVDQSAGAARVATLITARENLHVDFVYLDGNRVVVRAAAWASGAAGVSGAAGGAGRGAVFDFPFVRSANGTAFAPQPPQPYAQPCNSAGISIQLLAGAPGTFLLRLTNSGYLPCAVEGYPQLSGASGSGTTAQTRQLGVASGPTGGPQVAGDSGRAVVIVLNPGDVVTSAIRGSAACNGAHRVTVSLAPAGQLGSVATPFAWPCAVSIQALAPGITGHS